MTSTNPVPAPTPADLARDLTADLAIVEAAPPGPWHHDPQELWAMVTTQPRGHGAIVARGHAALVECRRYEESGTAAAIAVMRGAAPAAIRRAIAAESRVAELQREFDLRWKATQRAIDRWRAEDPVGRKLEQPDHADLCCWALERLATAEAECERLRLGVAEAADRLLAWCDMPEADTTMRAVSRYLRQLLKESNANG